MPFTNFPYGIRSFGVPVTPSAYNRPIGFGGKGNTTAVAPGSGPGSQIFFVNNALATASDVAGAGTNPLQPFKTINFAVTRCIANNGDVIYVGPGHVETVASAGALTIGVAGVTIIGIGNSTGDQPGVQYTTSTAATVLITAANVWIQNLRFRNSIDARVDGVVVSAAGCTLCNCVWTDDTGAGSLISIRTTASGTKLNVLGCYADLTENTGTQRTEFIRIVGGSDHLLMDNSFFGNYSTGTFNNVTTLISNIAFVRCNLSNTNAANLCIAILTTSTGFLNACMLSYTATHAITTAHILSADMASGQCIPGATPTVIGHA